MLYFNLSMCEYVIRYAMNSFEASKHSVKSLLEYITAIFSPNGSLNHLYLPHGVLNIVSRLLAKSSTMCQYPDVASFSVLNLDLASSGSMSSIVLEYHWFLSIALFNSLGSRHSLRLPFGFITGTMELIHSVCSLTSVIMPSLDSLTLLCMHLAWLLVLTWEGVEWVCTAPPVLCCMGLQAVFLFL